MSGIGKLPSLNAYVNGAKKIEDKQDSGFGSVFKDLMQSTYEQGTKAEQGAPEAIETAMAFEEFNINLSALKLATDELRKAIDRVFQEGGK